MLEHLGCFLRFLTILHQLHEGQQGQVKHSGWLLDSFFISSGVRQGYVRAPPLCFIFLSIMLCEAKEELPDGTIYIRFWTDKSLFNLRCLITYTEPIEELFTELLFADDWTLLAHIEEAPKHIINCFSKVKCSQELWPHNQPEED